MDVAMREDLVAAGMDEQQAEVLASRLPDWSLLATKADLEGFATKADLPDWSQFATKADLERLDLQIQGQLAGLQKDLVGLDRNDSSIQKELIGLHQAIASLKTGLVYRLWLPVALLIVTVISAAILPYVLSPLP